MGNDLKIDIGTLLDKYIVESVLNIGSFSNVYRARNKDDGRNVVLKQLKLQTTEPNTDKLQLAAFIKEGQLTKGLSEPQIVSCLSGFTHKGSHFLVFPYTEGETLKQHLEKIHFDGHMPESRFIELALQLLKIGKKLNEINLCHGDIKLSNLWLTKEGVLQLIDFGACAYARIDKKQWQVVSAEIGTASNKTVSHVNDNRDLLQVICFLLTGHQFTEPSTGSKSTTVPEHPLYDLLLTYLQNDAALGDLSEIESYVKQLQTETSEYTGITESPTKLVIKPHQNKPMFKHGRLLRVGLSLMFVSVAGIWAYVELISSDVRTIVISEQNATKPELVNLAKSPVVSAKSHEPKLVHADKQRLGNQEGQDSSSTNTIEAAEDGVSESFSVKQESKRSVHVTPEEVIRAHAEPTDLPAETNELPIIQRLMDEMIVIPGGRFNMGSNYGEMSERPAFNVDVSSFSIMSHEVTYDYLLACIEAKKCPAQMKPNSTLTTVNSQSTPVNRVSYYFVQHFFLPWLNSLSEYQFALPTETQWEFAAKAGSYTDYYWGDEIQADKMRCRDCEPVSSLRGPSKIKQYPPNQFGLYDMVGNLAELVNACWTENHEQLSDSKMFDVSSQQQAEISDCRRRVIKGGAWSDVAFHSRTSSRKVISSRSMSSAVGFRLVLLERGSDPN